MAFTLTDSQQTTCTISAVDKKNNPVTLPAGTVAWAVDSPTVIALTPSADGLTCVVAAAGALGDAKVSVTVSDPATQATIAAGTLDVTVTAGNATSITITPASPVEQP